MQSSFLEQADTFICCMCFLRCQFPCAFSEGALVAGTRLSAGWYSLLYSRDQCLGTGFRLANP